MKSIINDIRKEVAELDALLDELSVDNWTSNTTFKDWTPELVISHLCYFDLMTIYSINDSERFNLEGEFILQTFSQSNESLHRAQIIKDRLNTHNYNEIRQLWLSSNDEMCNIFEHVEPKLRCKWFGPDMGAKMFMTARYMETWSHGQEIYDLIGKKRNYNDAIKNIADIGVKTFEWAYINRNLNVPVYKPFISLVSPSGLIWEWNNKNDENKILGSASEFCHVVTQNRNINDTNLEVIGEIANHWMSIAQCFAGDPETPPETGTRVN